MHRMDLEACVHEPFGQRGDRLFVVIVEVRPGGEELDGFEAVRSDVDQVLAAEPMLVKEVRRDAEAVHTRTNAQCRMHNAQSSTLSILHCALSIRPFLS